MSQADVQVNGVQVEELSVLRVELEELRTQHTLLQTQLSEKDTLISSLVGICVGVGGTFYTSLLITLLVLLFIL